MDAPIETGSIKILSICRVSKLPGNLKEEEDSETFLTGDISVPNQDYDVCGMMLAAET